MGWLSQILEVDGMYSIVLMMALSTGAEAPAKKCCCGCDCGKCSKCSKKCNKCCGCNSCCCGCHCCGYSCCGCCGCYSCHGCCGCFGDGAPVMAPAAPAKTPETIPTPKKTPLAPAPATIVVSLPAEAK